MRTLLLLLTLASSPDAGTDEVQATPEELNKAVFQNKKALQLILSTNICRVQQDERELLARIKEEKDNAKIAGVVDLRELKDLQDEVVFQRKLLAIHRGLLKELKAGKALSCDSRQVEEFWACVAKEGPEKVCGHDVIRAMLRVHFQFEEQAKQELWAKD